LHYRPLGRTGESIPAVGQGTWGIGGEWSSNPSKDKVSIEAIRLGLELGMNLIDTAEMYGAGHSEEVVAEALEGRRERVFVASKVSPQHFGYDDVLRSARTSLKRLNRKQIDLYQLHWPNPKIPIAETMRAMEKLVKDGLIRLIGVSNFSIEQMREAQESLSREKIVSNQIEYSLVDRSPETGLLQHCQKEGVTVIAYSPLGQGKIPRGKGPAFKVLDEIASRNNRTRNHVALAWVLQRENTVVIPKASDIQHVRENAAVSDWKISDDDFKKLNRVFS
jgi:diketogulonate reductase-like aldo/keto reductase